MGHTRKFDHVGDLTKFSALRYVTCHRWSTASHLGPIVSTMEVEAEHDESGRLSDCD